MGPIEAEQKFDVFDEELLQRMQHYYESIGTYRSPVMNKASPGEALEWVDPIIRKHYPQIGELLGGNFYRHEVPYHPHVDHLPHWPLAVNFVIPIYQQGPPVDFIVFDQRWHMSPRTWSMVQKVTDFFRNGFSTTLPEQGIPGTSDIEFHTQKDIDRDFWEKHLDHGHKYYFGLSGKAFPFERRSLIMFETKKIHCTGKFKGNKLGLTLRYSVKQEET
jgi:hypothetical protein